MKKKFCENCGSKLSESAKFCGNCGTFLEGQNEEQESVGTKKEQFINEPDKQKANSKKKPEKAWKQKLKNGIIAGITITVFLWAFDTFIEPDYPKSKQEFAERYCGKCWHLESFNIEGLSINGEPIPINENSSDSSVINDFISELKNDLQKSKNDQSEFEIAKLASDGELIVYSQYFDYSLNEYVFDTYIPEVNYINDRFNLIVDGTQYKYSVKTGERIDTDFSDIEIINTVEKITDKKLEIIIQANYSGDFDILFTIRSRYSPITPTGEHRYESEFALWDQQ